MDLVGAASHVPASAHGGTVATVGTAGHSRTLLAILARTRVHALQLARPSTVEMGHGALKKSGYKVSHISGILYRLLKWAPVLLVKSTIWYQAILQHELSSVFKVVLGAFRDSNYCLCSAPTRECG